MITTNGNGASTVVRTGRGLTISGTRTTIYEVIDCLKADWPPALIRDWLMLTEAQLTAALVYIETHRDEVEGEYQLVLQEAEEMRTYWEARNRIRFQHIAQLPPPPGRKALYEKVRASKAALSMA